MSTETTSDLFAEHGEFLPLSVWATSGFPVDLIQEKTLPADRRPHPILGEMFRVRTTATTHTEERSNARKSSCTWQLNPRASNKRKSCRDFQDQEHDKQLALAGEQQILALEDGVCASRSASSFRSFSSSSSSSKKHKKKSKEDWKKSKKDKNKSKKDACV